MQINTTPETNRVNPTEARLVRTTFWAAWKCGACARTLLRGIVATGSMMGLDLSQEVAAVGPELEAATCCQSLSLTA